MTTNIRRITQLLVVDAIEPILPTWRDALGFNVLAEVPLDDGQQAGGDKLGFVLLERDDQHLMLQTRASLQKDIPKVAALEPQSLTYIDVESLDAAAAAVQGAEIVVERRTTFYGAEEIFFKLATGHVVGFAQHDPE